MTTTTTTTAATPHCNKRHSSSSVVLLLVLLSSLFYEVDARLEQQQQLSAPTTTSSILRSSTSLKTTTKSWWNRLWTARDASWRDEARTSRQQQQRRQRQRHHLHNKQQQALKERTVLENDGDEVKGQTQKQELNEKIEATAATGRRDLREHPPGTKWLPKKDPQRQVELQNSSDDDETPSSDLCTDESEKERNDQVSQQQEKAIGTDGNLATKDEQDKESSAQVSTSNDSLSPAAAMATVSERTNRGFPGDNSPAIPKWLAHTTNTRNTHAATSSSLTVSSAVSSLGTALHRVMRHPNLGRWTITGLQLGLAVYLVQAVWRAASELVDEFQAELGRDSSSPVYLERDMVSQMLHELEESSESSITGGDTARPSILDQQPVLAHLSKTLLAAGLPLRSDSSQQRSMEQVLLSLTRAEVNLLQQCLYMPSTYSLHHSSDSSSSSSRTSVQWKDICGLEPVKQSLMDLLWSLRQPNKSRQHHVGSSATMQQINPYSHLVQHPKGVLLYGPPGCGKTLLAKAIASEAQLPCLVVTPSLLLRKFVGDTNLQVRTLFQLAEKLSPCILCLDELDGLFRERSANEHEVSRDYKTEFLQWWDGMASNNNDCKILVVGATNRPFDVDSAVLRRMPQSHFVGLPHVEARLQMLQHLVRGVPLSEDFTLASMAEATEGYTPSDLEQLLRVAVMVGPVRESQLTLRYRSLTNEDLAKAKALVKPTPLTPTYRSALLEYAQRQQQAGSGQTQPPSPQQQQQQQYSQRHVLAWNNFFNAGTIHAETGVTLDLENDALDWTEEGPLSEYYDEEDSGFDSDETDDDGL